MNEKEVIIKGGATLWARQTIDSEIFISKPHVWFKIWFYIVNRVSHKDTKRYKRGETFLYPDWIKESTGATTDQIKKALAFFRQMEMISTRRSTRGIWLKILNYSHYQRLDNYYYNVKAPDKALEKHQRSTREAPRYNKNDKNEKNDKKDTNKEFDIFYKAYPKKIAKQNALKSFNRLKVNSTLLEKILADIERRKKSEAWKNKQYIQYPATYLNQQRWEDEYIEPEPEKKPYFRGEPMVKKFGKWKVISEGIWKDFAGSEKDIKYK